MADGPRRSSGDPSAQERESLRETRRAAAMSGGAAALVVAAYYALPVFDDAQGSQTWPRALGFGIGIVALALLFVRQIQFLARDPDSRRRRAQILAVGVSLAAVLFALCYYSMAHATPGSIAGLSTKTDGLYFSLTVLVTVGFGDVHAVSQGARIVVMVQMTFDVLFIVSAISTLRSVPRPVSVKYEDHLGD